MPLAQRHDLLTSRAIHSMFFVQLEESLGNTWISKLAGDFDSDQATETYAGRTTVPRMREWVGGKQFGSITEKSITVPNKDWEVSVQISNKDRRRDKTGQLGTIIGELVEASVSHEEELLSSLITSGTAATYGNAWTGTTFFSDSHTVGVSTWDNSIAVDISALPTGDTTGTHGTTTSPSVGEMALSIQLAIQTMFGFKDDQGRPINRRGNSFLVMVPTTLWSAANGATKIQNLAGGFNNPLAGSDMMIEVVQNAWLDSSWTDKFAVFRTGGVRKPFIVQREVPTTLKTLAEGSDYEFTNAGILASVEKSGNAAYWDPSQAVLVDLD